MAGYLNKIILIGNLGSDPIGTETKIGKVPLSTFSLATNKEWKDVNGEKKKRTTWHKVVAWRKKGELALTYLKKGNSVYVEGELTKRNYEDKEGNKRETVEVEAQHIIFLDSKNSSSPSDQPYPEPSVPSELDIPLTRPDDNPSVF